MTQHTVISDSRREPDRADPIVVTGAGIACALGLNKREVWSAIMRAQSGIGPLTAIEQHERCTKGGGQAPGLPNDSDCDLPREVRYLRCVLREAVSEADLRGRSVPPQRCGIVLGTTLAGMRSAGEFFRTGEYERLTRFTAASTLQLALDDLPVAGFATTTCSACASGLSSIAIAMTLLRTAQLDLVIAGGYDTLSEYAYAGFNSLRLVADGPIAPFARDRQGMKLGEGYGVLVLERLTCANVRGVRPLAQVLGFGESSDAHHLTQPHPEGDGARRAIEAALADAGLDAADIDMISAHATATPNNDVAEHQAYRQVFGDRLSDVPVVALKSHLGHTLGGAGAVELILSMLAIQHQCVPPTAGVVRNSIEFEDLCIAGHSMPRSLEKTVNVSMGFGGANACVVLARVESNKAHSRARSPIDSARDAMITGIGVIAPGCIGNEQFASRLKSGQDAAPSIGGPIEDSHIEHLINARRVRRMSEFAKIVLAASTIAIKDAGVDDIESFAARCNAILGSTHGAIDFSEKYYRQIVAQGIDAANPMLFAEGVPNVGSAQVSLMLKVRGSTQTIVGGRTAGLHALCIAMWRIQSGAWDRAIVGAAEEFHPLVNQAYEQCDSRGQRPPTINSSSGAVVLVLESRAEVQRRGARARGVVRAGSAMRVARATPRHISESIRQIRRALGASDDAGDIQHQCSIDGALRESFSVKPLAEIAAILLNGSNLKQVSVVDHDHHGLISGVALECIDAARRGVKHQVSPPCTR